MPMPIKYATPCYAAISIRFDNVKGQSHTDFHEHRVNIQAHALLLPQYRAEMSHLRGHLMVASRVDGKCLVFGEELNS